MGTELQEDDDAIEKYIFFALRNRKSMDGKSRSYALYSDIEMRLAWNGLSLSEDEDEEETEKGCRLLKAAGLQDDDNNYVTVTELLTSNANPQLIWHRESGNGNMVLHMVARGGNQSMLKKLMDFINIHKQSTFKFRSPFLEINSKGNTPLHLALEHCHKEVASLLINEMPPEFALAKLNHKGIMPVNLAIRAGYKDLVEDMLRRAPWSSFRQSKRDDLLNSSIVHDAIIARDLGLLQLVLENMPTLIESKFKGRNPLQYAAYKGCIDEFRYILDKFPSCDYKSDNDDTFPMLDAIAGDHLDIVKEIVSRFPEAINQNYDVSRFPESSFAIYEGGSGCRPLSFAARLGCLGVVCYFLNDFPSYASKCDEDGSFPIHKAVAGGHVDIVKEFISRCPETMTHVNGEGRSILHLVVEYARADVLCYLRSIPEIQQIYHLRDSKGNTFFDLAKKQMENWEKRDKLPFSRIYALRWKHSSSCC